MHSLKKIIIAVAAVIAVMPVVASAQNLKNSKSEVQLLKGYIKQLESRMRKIEQESIESKSSVAKAMIQADNAGAETARTAARFDQLSANAVDTAEFNRIRIKTEALEDANESNGFKNLKVSGYIDPTYLYNRNASTSSFVFLNNNSSINGSNESYTYDNTFFGSGMLTLEKELEGGSRFKLTLMPGKGTASGFNFGNLVHEATASVPLRDQSTRLIAGQFTDWTGYEYIAANQNKLITHNLLFDFSAGSFYTGAGLELLRGKLNLKILLANLNSARVSTAGVKKPALTYRGDYAMSEFVGLGFSGIHSGFDDQLQFGRLDLMEVDASYTHGDLTLQGQIGAGRQAATPLNGYAQGQSSWYGFSALASYKPAPKLETVARLDYINNSKHGGGVFGSTFGGICKDSAGGDANCPDGRNGFGSGMTFNGSDWIVADPSHGSNRSALALGINYTLMPGAILKGEYRYDYSTGKVFKTSDAQYTHDNHIFAVSTVLSF
jgi:hypothetical protein